MTSLLQLNISWEPNGVFVQASGIATFEEVFQMQQEILLNPGLRHFQYRIYDFLRVTRFEMSDENIVSHAAISRAGSKIIRGNSHQIAFVARNTNRNHQQFRMFTQKMESTNIDIRLFHDLAQARSWTNSTYLRNH